MKKKINKTMRNVIKHGEVLLKSVDALPAQATAKQTTDSFVVVGESETHGNDHRIAVLDKTAHRFYEKDGVLYFVATAPSEIFCPNSEKHEAITIEPGTWVVDKAREMDWLSQEVRQVAD
jgi:hypothetical protein